MLELIRELDYAGVKVLPIKYADGRIYHIYEYNTKFDNGLTDDEHQEWIAKGFGNGIAVLMSKVVLGLDYKQQAIQQAATAPDKL